MIPRYTDDRVVKDHEEEFQERKAIRTSQLEWAMAVQADLDDMANRFAPYFAKQKGLTPQSSVVDYKEVALASYRLAQAIASEGAHQYDRLRSEFPDFDF